MVEIWITRDFYRVALETNQQQFSLQTVYFNERLSQCQDADRHCHTPLSHTHHVRSHNFKKTNNAIKYSSISQMVALTLLHPNTNAVMRHRAHGGDTIPSHRGNVYQGMDILIIYPKTRHQPMLNLLFHVSAVVNNAEFQIHPMDSFY